MSAGFPTPRTQTGSGSASSTPLLCDLPDTILLGDLIVIGLMLPGANNVGILTPSGWTLCTSNVQNAATQFFAKFSAGGETSFSAVTTNGSARTVRHEAFVFDFTAHHSSLPVGASAGGHDPPAVNPAGWDVENTLWLAMEAGGTRTTNPTGYTLYEFSDGSSAIVGKENAVASEDPSVFGGSFDASVSTLAIRPAMVRGHKTNVVVM